jgi:menaquinone-dependent protoporphyrinogen IX oxidase
MISFRDVIRNEIIEELGYFSSTDGNPDRITNDITTVLRDEGYRFCTRDLTQEQLAVLSESEIDTVTAVWQRLWDVL